MKGCQSAIEGTLHTPPERAGQWGQPEIRSPGRSRRGYNPPVRAVVTRVTEASVVVDGDVVGRIGPGLLVLLGVAQGDGDDDAAALCRKVAELRIFADEAKPLNRSVEEVGGAVLVVSQFTLLADTSRGRRPSLGRAAPPAEAERLYESFVVALRARGLHVSTGRFGATMRVGSVNDGPVTILLSTLAGDDLCG